ncbi:Ribonucleotide reductase alpha subunit (NrdA) [Fructobacillus fructosus]|uniref:class 1b ribonucleoside-diphosphate reductase subunit alpha n=1 Tax=Fructobacillus fructosus TaxID=1631 RepID=UPI000219606B|nr:class 1b ribonucleoside-diphosphate reductase subunit alpha [Fructobacillus fructosus]KRN52353.1 ribonucleotide-diphosphate reductase subunit alpha [Fructobacillus fructosus KCTC 3544]GAP01437.1 ribonucleotide-diphosphate reductase subunit alpha [Fructobacillus fructosus]CAK1247073.1 Ribonucleotide reductase alpha subunit (NrdA) [Fructobacillus fructosus]
MSLLDIDIDNVKYFDLNNQVNIPKDGQIQLEKDQEALAAFMEENVRPNMKKFSSIQERFNWMIDHDFLEEGFVKKYDMSFIEKLYAFLEGEGFEFASFMAAFKFYNQYAQKTNDKAYYVESYIDRVAVNALFYADGDEELALSLANEMIHQRYQPATPSFLNAGRARRGELVSCFVLQSTDDMNSIGRIINSALQLSKMGGGVGINLSNVREAGAPVMGIANSAGGIVPIMKLLEDSFTFSSQVGARQGAGVVYLNIFHPDLMTFMATKKENADEKVRVKTLSLGLIVPDKFYELIKANDEMALFSPADVEREYGVPFNYVDITAEYDKMLANPKIHHRMVSARVVEEEISKLQQESGYPYIMNVDTVNRANPVAGKIVSSNLCSEILQVQTTSQINDMQEYTKMGEDISCNLGSINIVNMMKTPDFAASVESMIRALSFVSDNSDLNVVPSVQNGNQKNHAVGLGAMGLAAMFAQNQMMYGDEEALDFTKTFFSTLNYYSIMASMHIAEDRGETFADFDKSAYADGSYFDQYLNQDFSPKTEKVAKLFSNIHLPSKADWEQLKKEVMANGLYNAYRHAIAPTGSISYVNNTTASLHPIINRIEERQEGMIGKVYYPAPGLSNETLPYYQSAYDTDMRKVVDVYAAAQPHIDQGMSLTYFMRSTIPEGLYEWKDDRTNKMTTRDLSILRNYAFKKNIKTIYYVRTYTDDNQEAGVNECESCSI